MYPQISVITPSYNQGVFLEQCITSVLDQGYPHLQYIIIDGGSSDNSLNLIQKYQPHLAYWVSEPDQGQSDGLNKGFRQATGDLVAWLNADDFYLPDALHSVAGVYQANLFAPFYFGNGLRVDENGQPKRPFYSGNTPSFDRDALRFGLNYILQPATFIQRSSLVQINYLASHLHYGMDTDLWLRLAGVGDPIPVQAQLAASREYLDTKSASGSFARIEELRRIAETHTAMPITPGVICYFLDTLHRQAKLQPDVFPPGYRRKILHFWSESSLLLEQFGAALDGTPLPPSQLNGFWFRLQRRLRAKMWGWLKYFSSR